jgi:replicative DNA helicase
MHTAPESEAAVLGAVLGDPACFDLVSDVLRPDDFHGQTNREIWRAFLALAAESADIEAKAVLNHLRQTGGLERVHPDHLGVLWEAAGGAVNVEYHAGIVRDRATLRRLSLLLPEVQEILKAPGITAESAMQEVESRLDAIGEQRTSHDMVPIKEYLLPALERLEDAAMGTLSGLRDLDDFTRGWQDGTLTIVAARPSMGKSAMVTGFAIEAACRQEIPTALFSVEMGPLELTDRCYAYLGCVNVQHLRKVGKRGANPEDYVRLSDAVSKLNVAPLFVDNECRTVSAMRAKARRLKRTKGLGMIVVDHIHEMSGPGETNEQVVNKIAKDLKALARELDVPVIAAAQLHRGVEGRESKRPVMSDLRASGGVEEAADAVMMLYREDYYDPKKARDNNRMGVAEILVKKNRNGPTGVVPAMFHAEYSRFEDLTGRPYAAAA